MRAPIRLILFVTVVAAILELALIARLRLGVFDPRCLVLRSYAVSHSYPNGQEVIQCVRDSP